MEDEPQTLDDAWAAAEAALPDGWGVYLRPALIGDGYEAEAHPRGMWMLANGPLPHVTVEAPTPVEAVDALVRALWEGEH